jgi:hypothetical protein
MSRSRTLVVKADREGRTFVVVCSTAHAPLIDVRCIEERYGREGRRVKVLTVAGNPKVGMPTAAASVTRRLRAATAIRRNAVLCREPIEDNGRVTDEEHPDKLEFTMTSEGYVASVQRRSADGTLTWRLDPPDAGQDAFVRLELHASELVLTSWSGWRITTDVLSGVVAQRRFVK